MSDVALAYINAVFADYGVQTESTAMQARNTININDTQSLIYLLNFTTLTSNTSVEQNATYFVPKHTKHQ